MARGVSQRELSLATRCKQGGLTRYDYQHGRTAAMRASAIQNRWSPAIAHAAIADVVMAAERAFGPWTHRVRSLGRECYECYANGSSYRAHLSGLRTWNVFRDGQYRVQLKTIPEVETFINHDAGDVAQGRETLNAPHVEPSIAEPTTEAELVPDVVR